MSRRKAVSRIRVAADRTRSSLERAVRNRLAPPPPADPPAPRPGPPEGLRRLVALYEALRRAYAADKVPNPASDAPSDADVTAVRAAALRPKMFEGFFQMLCAEGDIDLAAVTMIRKMVRSGRRQQAVSIGQVLQRYPDLRPVADLCLAICALDHPMPQTAWTWLTRNDLKMILRLVPEEYLQLAFEFDPEAAAVGVRLLLSGSGEGMTGPDAWLNVAYGCLSAGLLALAAEVLDRADVAAQSGVGGASERQLTARLANLRTWVERAESAAQPAAVPTGEIPVALVGFQHPDWLGISADPDDPLDPLAVLGQLLRHSGVELTGEPGLVAAAERLQSEVPDAVRVTGPERTVRLYEVDRDASGYAPVPDGTWIIVSKWFEQELPSGRVDLPLNPKLRPLFVSFNISPVELAAPGAVEYLRAYGPVGCANWDAVFLLHAASVPAFFSGSLAATLNTVVPPRTAGQPSSETLFVDSPPSGPGTRRSRNDPGRKSRPLGENLVAAAEDLRSYRDAGAHVVTRHLRFSLAARAVGCSAEFRPGQPGLTRISDYLDVTDAAVQEMQHGISDKLASVFAAIVAGRAESEVYEHWRELCADDVAAAAAELRSEMGEVQLSFDLEQACAVVRAASVTIERRQPGPDGPEINVEFSLDGNYTHQLDVVLDSVVQRCSRPVRAFLPCRGLDRAHFDRTAELFPTVSFVWLPTDDVDYGHIGGMNAWVTAATMDRTILPALLEDVHRIIHFDLDALCLGDLAELFDVDMEGNAIAGVTTPQPRFVSGFDTWRRNAERLRKEGKPELARELVLRTYSRNTFDVPVFNAGIMLLDLDKMRVDDFCGRYLPYVERFGLNGQVVLNTYVGANRKVIDNEWNRLIRLEATTEAKAVHWVGEFKPWRDDWYVTGRELWRAQEEHFAARTRGLAGPASAVDGDALAALG
jgi:lipopolysaccharide biosynthesis glycosyltransferase